jgi:hypothetical protein
MEQLETFYTYYLANHVLQPRGLLQCSVHLKIEVHKFTHLWNFLRIGHLWKNDKNCLRGIPIVYDSYSYEEKSFQGYCKSLGLGSNLDLPERSQRRTDNVTARATKSSPLSHVSLD